MKPRSNPFIATRAAPAAPGGVRFLTFELDRASVDATARTVALSFSSETPVDRYFGAEILDHSPSAVRMGRLNNGGALLLNHDVNQQIGVVDSATIDPATRKGRAVVRFSKCDEAEEIFQDVLDGIRRLVSVGYRIYQTVTDSKSGGQETVRVTDWEPYEISLVSIPADDSVGVGRAEPSAPAPNFQTNTSTQMNTIETPAAPVAAPVITAARAIELPASAELIAETARIDALTLMGTRAAGVQITLDVERAIADGTTPAVMQERFTAALCARNTPYAPPAITVPSQGQQRDLSSFSLVRAINALSNNQPLTGVELEMHQEAKREAQQSGLALRGGLSLPTVLLNHGQRTMSATGQTSVAGDQGGSAIATNLGSFIELLYARMVLRGLGAQFLTGMVGNFSLPKLVTGSAPVKKAENTAADASSPTTGIINFSPKRLPTYIEVSKQLLMQSSTSVDAILRNDLATALALGMELGAINGGGTNEPTGILNVSGIGSVAGGTNGAAPTLAHIIGLETLVATANADIGSLAYLASPKIRGKLKSTQRVSGTDSRMIWDEGSTPLNGYRAAVTTQMPDNLTKGSSSIASAILFGNFADLVIAQWGGIDIQVNPYIKDTEGLVRITADVYYDANIRRAGSFAAMKDALSA